MNYEKIKAWLIDHKKDFYLAVGFVVVFASGYGTGLGEQANRQSTLKQNDYITKADDSKATITDQNAAVDGQISKDKPNPNDQTTKGECKIKGTSSKIYHVAGGAFYNRVTSPAACFNTEAEAQAAGYRKSSR